MSLRAGIGVRLPLTSVLAVTTPFFGLVACGFAAGRGRLLGSHGTAGLNGFVFYFALPALFFSTMAASSLSQILYGTFIATYLGIGLTMYGAAATLGRWLFKATASEAAILGLAACFSNIGLMGLPLLVAARGESVALPLALIAAVDTVTFVPLTMFIIEMSRGNGDRWRRLGRSLARVTIGNPVVLAIVAGIAVSAAGLHPGGALARFIGLLSGAAGPCALFALGASLAEQPMSGSYGRALYMTICKLIVHPAVVLLVMGLVGIDPLWTDAAALGMAMPIAVVLFVIAQQYNVYAEAASAAVLASTTASVLSVSVLLALLGGG